MPRLSQNRLDRYVALANRDLFDLKDPDFGPFLRRAVAEGVEMISNNFNTLGMFRAPHSKDLDALDLAMIGLPLDLGVPNPRPGTRKGPEAVRYWSLDRNMVNHFTRTCPFDLCRIADWGDLEFSTNPYSLDACLDDITALYDQLMAKDVTPLSIGGEHTCTYGILRALSNNGEDPLALVHIDAHADTATNFQGVRVSDATLFQVATVEGFIDPEKTIQIGLRGRGVPRAEFGAQAGMRVMLAEEMQSKGVEYALEEARRVVGSDRVYLSIDTDAFDCSIMPGTTLPEPFGLTGEQMRDIIRGLYDVNVVGADLVELSPVYDPTGMSACLAAGTAFEMLCLLAEARARRQGERRQTRWSNSESDGQAK
ncbi:arginase family protein [Ruegeria meonggei]|uniref:arginase family protein n=1 Tax=Ruegeria meonggei TaxID=1446476 RepID=UPI00367280C8